MASDIDASTAEGMIAEYEENAPEFEDLNRLMAETPQGIAALRTLMDQYGLKPADLADGPGSKSNVSNILNGRRALTVQHIKALAVHFNVPADLYVPKKFELLVDGN